MRLEKKLHDVKLECKIDYNTLQKTVNFTFLTPFYPSKVTYLEAGCKTYNGNATWMIRQVQKGHKCWLIPNLLSVSKPKGKIFLTTYIIQRCCQQDLTPLTMIALCGNNKMCKAKNLNEALLLQFVTNGSTKMFNHCALSWELQVPGLLYNSINLPCQPQVK